MKATWSATRWACCRLWVTITIAISLRSATIVSSITWVEIGSSAEQGSSSSSTSGRTASERAMQSRCCWPPESAQGRVVEVVLDLLEEAGAVQRLDHRRLQRRACEGFFEPRSRSP